MWNSFFEHTQLPEFAIISLEQKFTPIMEKR